jgi:homoserine O-acetyltransferase/O-succinyltransferase
MSILQVMFSSAARLWRLYPTRAEIDGQVDGLHEYLIEHQDDFNFDVNNQIFAWNASHTYDPQSKLGEIKAPLTAVNTADDMMNPPGLGVVEKAIQKQMKKGLGKAVTIPESNKTMGHASYILAELWQEELQKLLDRSAPKK